MRPWIIALCALGAGCTAADDPSHCWSAGDCTADRVCAARPDLDGGTFCTPTLGLACAGDADCAPAQRCHGATPGARGVCGPPDGHLVACVDGPRTGDACEPVPSGYECLFGAGCNVPGPVTFCDCDAGRWRCLTGSRDFVSDGSAPACGTSPLCWVGCVPPTVPLVECTATSAPQNGDPCAPLPAGYVCHRDACAQSGETCWCRAGHWMCSEEARDWAPVDGGPVPCGTPPRCWSTCGTAPT